MMAPELSSGEVIPLLPGWSLSPLELWAVYPAGRLTSAKAQAFVRGFERLS